MSQRKPQRNPKMLSDGSVAHALAEKHLTLVACIARDIHQKLPADVRFEDLVGAGNVGLVESAWRFDPTRGASFTTFARHRIRGAITDSLRRLDPVSRNFRTQQKKAEQAVAFLTAHLGRQPSEAEVAAHLQIPVARWRTLRRQLHEAGCGIDGSWAAARRVCPESLLGTWHEPERNVELGKIRYRLGRAMQALPPRHQYVIRLHDFEEWTLKRIGEKLGVHESRVSQIRSAKLELLKAELLRYGTSHLT